MATKKKTVSTPLTLAEIRAALEDVEKRRASTDISEEERTVLEEASITLRDAERSAITDVQKGIIKDFEEETKKVKLQAKEINAIVTRLNKLPKALDTTEGVIKECVRVLKAIAKWTLMIIFALFITSCASMSKAQLSKVKSLSINADTVTLAPQMLFERIADVRKERGLLYAASLDGVENRIGELDRIWQGSQEDSKIVSKSGVYVKTLNSYIRALKSLSADTRWKRNGTELKGIGRNVDSLIIAYNKTEWGERIEPGLSRQLGQTTGYVAENLGKKVQYRKMKEFLTVGDTLVSECCDALVRILKKEGVSELIENEESGLKSNYTSYLNSMTRRKMTIPFEADSKYIELRDEINNAREIQNKCVKALNSLKSAHHKLLLEMDKHRKYSEIETELEKLAEEAADLMSVL